MKKQPLPQRPSIGWTGGMYYFLTNSTYLHYPYFREPEQKHLVLNFIKKLSSDYSVPIQAYSISINHHHLMFFADRGEKVTFVKRFLKSNISREYRKKYKVPYKEFWHSTRCYYIKTEEALLSIQGYIIGNLLKHREVDNFQELYSSPFCSFRYVADDYGMKAAQDMVLNVIEVEEDSDGRVDLGFVLGAVGKKKEKKTPAKAG